MFFYSSTVECCSNNAATNQSCMLNVHLIISSSGPEIVLINLKSLPYGNYFVPLKIADQQGAEGHDVLHVVVCDCGKGDVCLDLLPRSSTLHGAAIGILIGALLLLACESFHKLYLWSYENMHSGWGWVGGTVSFGSLTLFLGN